MYWTFSLKGKGSTEVNWEWKKKMPRKKNKNAELQAPEIAPSNVGVEAYYDDDKRGAGFYIGIIIAALALVAALVVGTWLFLNSTQVGNSFRDGRLGQLDGKTEDEIRAELDRIVEEGMFNISIARTVTLETGNSEGEFRIENSPANRYNMQVDIALADTGEVIYSSDIIEPNYHIQYAKLDKVLPAGTYNCIATFHALDPETDDEIGQAACAITIIVLR